MFSSLTIEAPPRLSAISGAAASSTEAKDTAWNILV